MLPFLEPRKTVSIIVSRKNEPSLEVKHEIEASDEIDPALKSCAEDLLQAIDERSVLGIASAFKSAFEICESMPHEEYDDNEEGEEEGY